MYIIDSVPEVKDYLNLQKLFPCERLMTDQELETMQERENINTPYIMSIFFEKHFKEMINQYLRKTVICG